jgi:hypothetical protein
MILISLFEHDLFQKKSVPAFPDHAPDLQRLIGDFGSVGPDGPTRANSDAAALLQPGAVGAIM